MLLAREVDVPADPLRIARQLVDARGKHVALLHASELGGALQGRRSFVTANPDRRCVALDPLGDDDDFGTGASGTLAGVPRWIGVVPYECRRGLERATPLRLDRRPAALTADPEWHRYPAVVAVDHDSGRVSVVGTGRDAVDRLVSALRSPFTPKPSTLSIDVRDDEPTSAHAARIVAAKELIARGDLYQVNLARRLHVRLLGGDSLMLYANLSKRAPTPFGAYLELDHHVRVVSTSPELLLRAEPARDPALRATTFGLLFTAPIKGTRPRGADARTDAELAVELDEDPKECAELTMIVDVERHDLGRIAEIGSVRLASTPRVSTHRTVHHRAALLTARTRAGVTRDDVLRSMLPSGSVTGAPKVRAMAVIAQLEPRRRGLYTGGIGFVGHDGSMTLSMAIRTVVLAGDEGEYWTGGGIVADSDPLREVEETRWKALQLQRAASGEP